MSLYDRLSEEQRRITELPQVKAIEKIVAREPNGFNRHRYISECSKAGWKMTPYERTRMFRVIHHRYKRTL